jgi:hypothetical protein
MDPRPEASPADSNFQGNGLLLLSRQDMLMGLVRQTIKRQARAAYMTVVVIAREALPKDHK